MTLTEHTPESGGRRWLPTGFAVVVIGAYSLEPFLGFLDTNRSEIAQVSTVLLYGALVWIVSLLAVTGVAGVFRADIDRVAVTAAAFLFVFFGYGLVLESNPPEGEQLRTFLIWLAVSGIVVYVAGRLSSSPRWRVFVLVFGLLFAAIPGLSFLFHRLTLEDPTRAPTEAIVGAPFESTPNVYWFLFDEYGRGDQLEAVHSFDNRPFEEELRTRGLSVSDSAYTSYPVTALSVASVLEMRYVATSAADVSGGAFVHSSAVRGDAEVVRRFRAEGYRYVYSEAGKLYWARCDHAFVDVCLPAGNYGRQTLGELELALLDLTPVGLLDLATEPRTDPLQVIDELDARRRLIGEPFLLFAHILSPHEPYRYEDGCARRAAPVSALDAAQYLRDLECLNTQILEAVDNILADDPDAIIVLQSDTGSKFTLDLDAPVDDWSDAELLERYAIFEAIRLPEACAPPTGTHTNIDLFPTIIGCLSDEPVAADGPRAFMWAHRRPTELTEIVDAPWLPAE